MWRSDRFRPLYLSFARSAMIALLAIVWTASLSLGESAIGDKLLHAEEIIVLVIAALMVLKPF